MLLALLMRVVFLVRASMFFGGSKQGLQRGGHLALIVRVMLAAFFMLRAMPNTFGGTDRIVDVKGLAMFCAILVRKRLCVGHRQQCAAEDEAEHSESRKHLLAKRGVLRQESWSLFLRSFLSFFFSIRNHIFIHDSTPGPPMVELTFFSVVLALLALLVAILILMRLFAARVYDIMIVHMTSRWYAAVIECLPAKARVLDIGIGTASALVANRDEVSAKQLAVVGVDYEASYIARAEAVVKDAGLYDRVDLVCASVYDVSLQSLSAAPFDVAYFSGSISLMPDPPGALKAVARLLRPGGRIYVTQTFQRVAPPGFSVIKPLLKYVTTVDFGQLTFEADLLKMVKDAGMRIERNEVIPGSIDNRWQAAFLVVIDPRQA